ncbi:J domain-containing protein [Rhizobacter fulvus]
MPKVHNHYDNLKVARDASPDEIRAAYRALTRKHHPDRNAGVADAQRVMSVINVAYEVLSDPARRREHDAWIAQAESPRARPLRSPHTLHSPTTAGPAAPPAPAAPRRDWPRRLARQAHRLRGHALGHRWQYALAATLALLLLGSGVRGLFEPTIGQHLAATPRDAAARNAGFVRPTTAPNGQPWPAGSGYVAGYELLNDGGLSEITVDNANNDTDMFVKLFSLDGVTAQPVRTFLVLARTRFTLLHLTTGTYDVRYRNLANGALLRSPALILEEVRSDRGTQHSTPHVRLYQPGEGAMQTYALGEADF